ncbi:MAG: glycosyltransferase [Maricaulaceae bacterium]|nr:glycosyltransferase [Maricaulaceae bacterium]
MPVSAANPPGFCIAVPVGDWHPGLAATLRSLKLQNAIVHVSLCDASGGPRVSRDADASGIKFAYRRHGADNGQAAAIAEAWREAPGDIVSWLNADDVLMPGALAEAAAAFAADPDLDVFCGHSTVIDARGATTGLHPAVRPPGDLLLRSCIISQPSCFVRRRAVEAVGGLDDSLHYTMDWDLWTRLYRAGARFRMTETVLSAVLLNAGTKTASMPPQRLAEIWRIVRPAAGRFAALKSQAGFLMHHVANYTPLRGVVRALRIHASGGPGRIRSEATLPVINLTSKPAQTLTVRFRGSDAALGEAAPEGMDFTAGAQTVLVLLAPVAPGDTVRLRLKAPDRARLALLEARLTA